MEKRGFTLLELMLVVLIIGLIYGLSLSGLKQRSEEPYALTLETLPEYLKRFHHRNTVAAVCTDRCLTCDLYVDGEVVKSLDPFVDDSAAFYRFDLHLGTRDVVWTPLFDEGGREKEVCFRYDIRPDGSSEEMMVLYKNEVIDYPGYFAPAARFASLDDAIESKRSLIREVTQ